MAQGIREERESPFPKAIADSAVFFPDFYGGFCFFGFYRGRSDWKFECNTALIQTNTLESTFSSPSGTPHIGLRTYRNTVVVNALQRSVRHAAIQIVH